MKRIELIIALMLLMLPMVSFAQAADDKDKWEPVPTWPFLYEEFSNAIIHTTALKVVKAKANVHAGNSTVWYENNGKRLEANKTLVQKVVFDNGDTYYVIKDKLCQVICEDSVDGGVSRLYMCHEVDKEAFNEIARINNQSTMSLMDVPGFISSAANSVADREGGNRIDQEPLPMKDKFFILYKGDIFEANESSILKHLSKQERPVYLSYTRKAEVLSYSRKSMENVWNTFFTK